tara:strand:- start:23 stop:1090 length:1068 start_codon:yes stop_codon:yes gene_type:complete
MDIFKDIEKRRFNNIPLLIDNKKKVYLSDIIKSDRSFLKNICPGDVVILIGDYDELSISTFLYLISIKAIIVPLTKANISDIEYNITATNADYIVEKYDVTKIKKKNTLNYLIENLKKKANPGLIFFSTGTTGKPKAILHDTTLLFKRFETPRPPLKAINFLMFDHMGGINTLLHIIYNGGTIISPEKRNPEYILELIKKYNIELLPTTPTFLRMLLMSGMIPKDIPSCLKIITYGSEKMDESTLKILCNLLPNIDFRQTYGLTEFSVLRLKSKSRNSLFFKIGGEGLETKIIEKTLYLKSKYRMEGYLNADDPFDRNGWYNTKDVVEQDGEYIKIIGRNTDVVNVGGQNLCYPR